MSMEKRKIFLVISLILVVVGGWVFVDGDEEVELETEEAKTYIGNLTIRSSNSEEGWHLSYETDDSSGEIKKINIKNEDISCLGDPDSCGGFFQKDENLAGSRVELEGAIKDNFLQLKNIEFLEDKGCNFDLTHFNAEEEDFDNYTVDFSTNPDAEEFRARIDKEVEKGPNFAGRYVYAEWGCGSSCGAGAIVDPESGEIVEFGILNSHGVDFQKDSRLLIVNPPKDLKYLEDSDLLEGKTTKYFLMSDEGLLLLCEK